MVFARISHRRGADHAARIHPENISTHSFGMRARAVGDRSRPCPRRGERPEAREPGSSKTRTANLADQPNGSVQPCRKDTDLTAEGPGWGQRNPHRVPEAVSEAMGATFSGRP